jgi:mono/diheme cytochrome c family protein
MVRTIPAVLAFLAMAGAASAQQSTPAANPPAANQTPVTFTKDVAPILQRSCQTCHRPGAVAPMSLLTYEDVRPWARAIKTKVTNREMPPWHIDRNIGITKFKNDPSLTDQEIATIAKWVDAGAPRGNPADMPPPRKFEELDQWFIGKPDLVITSNKPYVLPAAGPDNIVDILVDPGFTEDMYVMAIESKPADAASFKVTHHFTTNLVEDPDEDPVGLFLNEYALGKNGDVFPPNSGRLIKAGTKINFNLHLNPRGEETPVSVKLGLKVYPKGQVPKYVAFTQHMGDAPDLDIPAGSISRHDGYFRLPRPVLLASFQPHMHNRGKAQCIEAIYPDLIRIRRGPGRLGPRQSAASATTSSAGTSRIRMPTTWRRSCRRGR